MPRLTISIWEDLYNSDEISIYVQYLDGNNQNGTAMIEKQLTHGFAWKKKVHDFTTEKWINYEKKLRRLSFRSQYPLSKRAAQKPS